LAALSCAYLMYNLPYDTWVRFGIWTALGFATYFLYSYRHSKLGKGE
ncbi:MAG: amino acid permease, partial [Selenomonadales bacterium]|nr:amino acid permease [Selenomonadales bacterium]